VEEIQILSSVNHGADVASGASLALRQASIEGVSGTALNLAGTADLENVLIGGPATGIVVAATGSLDLENVTLADSTTGAGVDNTAGGTVTIAYSILWNNAAGDLLNVPCSAVSWSDVGSVNCSSVNNNLQQLPLFAGGGYYLQSGSPALDYGPDPTTSGPAPCLDLGGGPRFRDWDGQGMAERDLGCYEHFNATLQPQEVVNLRWTDNVTLTWDAETTTVSVYNVYRDTTLGPLSYGQCRNDLDPSDRTDTTLTDTDVPSVGEAFFYLITADDGAGEEGTLGLASCTERGNFSPCM